MIVKEMYSHNDGEAYIRTHHPHILDELCAIIGLINAEACRLKEPKGKEADKARKNGITHFFSPSHLNLLFDLYLVEKGWDLRPLIKTHDATRAGTREMDALKDKVGLEVQLGKYAFLTYDIVVKMPIFHNMGLIDCGIEICPMASMLPQMSSGIGAFEQVVWDLRHYQHNAQGGVPALIMGFEPAEGFQTSVRKPSALATGKPEPVLNRFRKFSKKDIAKFAEIGFDRIVHSGESAHVLALLLEGQPLPIERAPLIASKGNANTISVEDIGDILAKDDVEDEEDDLDM